MNAPVLLLDAGWRIDRVIRSDRAVELLIAHRAVPASDDVAAIYRSQTLSIEVPSVLAATGGRIKPVTAVSCTHRKVRTRDEHQCQFVHDGDPCRGRGDSVDHLVPRSAGGPSTWTNLVAACRRCNGIKADRPLSELMSRRGWSLRRQPYVPTFGSLLSSAMPTHPVAWEPYLAG